MPVKRQEIWKCLWNEFETKLNGIETTSRNGVWLPERIKWIEMTHLQMELEFVNIFGGLIGYENPKKMGIWDMLALNQGGFNASGINVNGLFWSELYVKLE